MFVNGVRLGSQAILEEELSIGDPVTVDVIANQVDMTTTYMSGTDTFWMALSVKVNTADRGLTLSNRLRAEVSILPCNMFNIQLSCSQNSHDFIYFSNFITVCQLMFFNSETLFLSYPGCGSNNL